MLLQCFFCLEAHELKKRGPRNLIRVVPFGVCMVSLHINRHLKAFLPGSTEFPIFPRPHHPKPSPPVAVRLVAISTAI